MITSQSIEQLGRDCTIIVQNLRAIDDGSCPEYRALVNRIHNLCDGIEQNAEIGRINADLGLRMMLAVNELIEEAKTLIQARKPLPPTSADDQPGEEA